MSNLDVMKNKIKKTRNAQNALMGEESNVIVNDHKNMDNNIHVNKDVNMDIDNNNNFLEQLVNEEKKIDPDALTEKTGVYLKPKTYNILMELSKKGGRGAKSRITNDALEAAFKSAGLWK